MGRWSFMTPPGGKRQLRTVLRASALSKGHFEGDLILAEMTFPLLSTVNSTITVPVCPLRLE